MTPEQWLKDPRQERCLLAKINYLYGGVKQAYVGTHSYSSLPEDTPANQAFDELLMDTPSFSRRMGIFTGRTSAARSTLGLFAHSWLDDLLAGNVFDQAVELFIGDKDWPLSSFIQISEQLIERAVAQNDLIRIETRDSSLKLDKVIDTGTFSTGANKGKAKPLCVGDVFNIEPVLEDAATHRYRAHFDAVDDIPDVRDNGLSVSFTKDVANGSFNLSQAPTGKITCNVRGAKPSDYLQYPAEVISWLLTRFASETKIGDLSSLPTVKIGIYQREPKKVRGLIDLICASCNAYHYYSRLGQFNVGLMPELTNSFTKELTLDDIQENGLRIRKTIEPVSKVVVNYRQNHTEQSSALAGSIDAATRELFSNKYQSVEAVNDLPDYPNAQPITIDTCLVELTDAQALASSKALAASVKRTIYEVNAFGAPFLFELGDEINVTAWGYGFSSGKTAIVTALTDDPINGEVTLELWR